ncbi:hypothetical protein GOP47_0028612 [Adiantum capillus-veneris]|nr:hypothetical protein GOP47_0028612 [Adiantum capillus-veneris]
MQLKEEDCRSILFETWQDCDKILKTCQQGRLPSAENGYEFVSQLQPAQINNLVNSISAKLNPSIVSEATMQEWAQISIQFKEANSRLFTSFHKDLIPGLMLISGVSLPLSMSPEEGIELLLKVPFSQEVIAHYAAQIVSQAQPLIDMYKALFELLPSTPEVVFVQQDITVSQEEADKIQAVHNKARDAVQIFVKFHRLRSRIRNL